MAREVKEKFLLTQIWSCELLGSSALHAKSRITDKNSAFSWDFALQDDTSNEKILHRGSNLSYRTLLSSLPTHELL